MDEYGVDNNERTNVDDDSASATTEEEDECERGGRREMDSKFRAIAIVFSSIYLTLPLVDLSDIPHRLHVSHSTIPHDKR